MQQNQHTALEVIWELAGEARTHGRIDSDFCLSTGAADSAAALGVATDGCDCFSAVGAPETPFSWSLLTDLPPRPFRRLSGELVAAKGACKLQSQGYCLISTGRRKDKPNQRDRRTCAHLGSKRSLFLCIVANTLPALCCSVRAED